MLKNLEPVPEPEVADVTYFLDVGIAGPNYEAGKSVYASTNRLYMFDKIKPWKKPLTPLLHTKGECGADDVPFITVPENATTVEVIINNLSPTAHVLHMHGMYFSVINYANFSDTWCSASKPQCFSMAYDKAVEGPCPGARRGDPNTTFSVGDDYWGCPYDPATDKHSQ